jgi:predicted nucleotidyltransferase
MPLPDFNSNRELPEGVYQATLNEVMTRFGSGTSQRETVTARLQQIYKLAKNTGKLQRLIIFGSYITAKPEPNDIDIVLIFDNDFDVMACDEETKMLLDHQRATRVFGASVFWTRPSLLFLETLDEFIEGWQTKRDGNRREIVEVKE